jgi:hypothetical protein
MKKDNKKIIRRGIRINERCVTMEQRFVGVPTCGMITHLVILIHPRKPALVVPFCSKCYKGFYDLMEKTYPIHSLHRKALD